MNSNPLLIPWSGPLGGLPAFSAIRVEHFEPAIDAGIADLRARALAVRETPEPPTFDNTLAALERTDALLQPVLAMYYLWSSNLSSPALREVRLRVAPRLAESRGLVYQDRALYARVRAVAESGDLSAEQARLCEVVLRDFRHAGVQLDAPGRDRVRAIGQRLATLYTLFSDRVLADEEGIVHFVDEGRLEGMSDAYRAAAAARAAELGRPGECAITNTRSSVAPLLTACTDRALRRQVWEAFYKRGDNRNGNDTRELIVEILELRRERALLLGFASHAHLRLSVTMAETPERVMDLLRRVWAPAAAKFEAELAASAALSETGDIAPWDVRYLAELRRRSETACDPDEISRYHQLEQLVDGMFWAVGQNHGWSFVPLDIDVFHPDVRAWRVDDADGSPRGVFLLDPFARPGKRSGAWMTAYRVQSRQDGAVLPIVSNNCNYVKGADGAPTLLSADEARTLFHEFGHAMHGLSSEVTYRSLAGTSVPRDFVEFPSQLNEHWQTTPELLGRFALHRDTGAPLPPELLERLRAARNLSSGFRTMEFLASAVMDMEMHLADGPIDPAVFEDATLTAWGLPPQVVMRHRTPHFAHVFSSDGYSAGYYSYLWADVLVADAAEAFAEVGFYDPEMNQRLMQTVLSVGNTVPPSEAFRSFRGRDPRVDALLRERGMESSVTR